MCTLLVMNFYSNNDQCEIYESQIVIHNGHNLSVQLKGLTITIHVLFVCLLSLAYNLVRTSFSELILCSLKPRAPKLIEHAARALLALCHFLLKSTT